MKNSKFTRIVLLCSLILGWVGMAQARDLKALLSDSTYNISYNSASQTYVLNQDAYISAEFDCDVSPLRIDLNGYCLNLYFNDGGAAVGWDVVEIVNSSATFATATLSLSDATSLIVGSNAGVIIANNGFYFRGSLKVCSGALLDSPWPAKMADDDGLPSSVHYVNPYFSFYPSCSVEIEPGAVLGDRYCHYFEENPGWGYDEERAAGGIGVATLIQKQGWLPQGTHLEEIVFSIPSVSYSGGRTAESYKYFLVKNETCVLASESKLALPLNVAEGMRTIESLDEILPFTHSVNAWGEASAAASATITWSNSSFSFEPQLMGTYADGDVVTWVPNGNGTYIFKHQPGSGLTATFNVDISFTGSGTEEDPYVVLTAKGLSVVAGLGGWVRLGADIISDATLPAGLMLYLDLNGLTLSGTMINNGMLTLLDGVGGCNPALDITGSGTVIDNMVKVDNLVFKQRYPWNGLVDVSYEASGLLEGKTYEVRFTLTKDDMTKTFSLTNVVNGTNKYVWNAAAPDAFGEGVSNATVNVEAVIYCTSKKEAKPSVCQISTDQFESIQAAIDSLSAGLDGTIPAIKVLSDCSGEVVDLSACTHEFVIYADDRSYLPSALTTWTAAGGNHAADWYVVRELSTFFDTFMDGETAVDATGAVWYHKGIATMSSCNPGYDEYGIQTGLEEKWRKSCLSSVAATPRYTDFQAAVDAMSKLGYYSGNEMVYETLSWVECIYMLCEGDACGFSSVTATGTENGVLVYWPGTVKDGDVSITGPGSGRFYWGMSAFCSAPVFIYLYHCAPE